MFQLFFQTLLNNMHTMGILALTTTGLTLCYKTANVTNFSQSIISTFGAFTGGFVMMHYTKNVWIATLAGIVLCFLIGMVIDAVIIRRCSPQGNGRVMITLGLIVLFNAILPMIFGMVPYDYVRFFKGNFEFTLGGVAYTITKNGLFTFGVAAVVVICLFVALQFTKWGLGIRATASNKNVAAMVGINTNKMTAISWAVSSACGGLAALCYATQITNIQTGMLGTIQSNSLLALVVGGFATFYGPMVGAILIVIATVITSMVSSVWSHPLMYILALLFVLIRPAGLFGKQAAKKV